MASEERKQTPKDFSEPSYAVHRPSDTRQSFFAPHVDAQGDNDAINTPPPYSGPTTPSMTAPSTSRPQLWFPGLPKLDYGLYAPTSFTLSEDQTTITSYQRQLSEYPGALVSLIKKLATVPPKPQIRIVGKNVHGTADFDVKINFMNLILPDEDKVGHMNYVKIIGPGEMGFRGETSETTKPNVLGGLEEWARRFCKDPSSVKSFTLERKVINWDTSYIEGRLLSLISSISYRGHVTITFPITHAKVVVHSPDKVNRFFSNVTKVFMGTRKYEVVKSIWPYADVARGEQGRRCAVQEEEIWFNDWRDAIRQAILGKRQGWVTAEDRLEFLMEPRATEQQKPADWGNA